MARKPAREKIVGYVRVSTDEQANSGYGIAAQRSAIHDFVSKFNCKLVAIIGPEVPPDGKVDDEYIKQHGESAKGLTLNKRPTLRDALDLCRKERATLLVQRVDRLTRNFPLLKKLRGGDVDIKAVEIDGDYVGEMAEIAWFFYGLAAQRENELRRARGIEFQRRRKEIAEAKGEDLVYFGGKRSNDGGRMNRQVAKRHLLDVVWPAMRSMFKAGMTWDVIAAELNSRGITTRLGARWTGHKIADIYRKQMEGYLKEDRRDGGKKAHGMSLNGSLSATNVGKHAAVLAELEGMYVRYSEISHAAFQHGLLNGRSLPYASHQVRDALKRIALSSGNSAMLRRIELRGKRHLAPSDLPNPAPIYRDA